MILKLHLSVFMLIIDQMTVCNVNGLLVVAKPTENYHTTLHFHSALRRVVASFSSFICFFLQPQLHRFGSLSSSALLAAAVFSYKILKAPRTPPAQQ